MATLEPQNSTGYLLTAQDRLKAQSDEAKKARRERRRAAAHQREDVVLLRKRGMVPLAISDELGISLRRVVVYLEEAGERLPGYLTTWDDPPRGHPCSECGRYAWKRAGPLRPDPALRSPSQEL